MASRVEVIGEEWKKRSRELADWAMDHLVNRKDVWGQYSPLRPSEQRRLGRKSRVMTLPMKHKRGTDMVSLDKLARHFASLPRVQQIIGLHAKSDDNMSRWLAIDIDLHDPDAADAEITAQANFIGALSWFDKLEDLGYDPLLCDSNGMGGFHLIILFREPAPTTDVYELGQTIIADWEKLGLSEEPETFPKSPGKSGSFGSWLRLPGLHHSRPHYHRIWSGDGWLDDPWLTGNSAVESLLGNLPGPPPPAASSDSESKKAAAKREADLKAKTSDKKTARKPKVSASRRKTRFTPTARPKACIDLDGVLAQHISWQGIDIIGDPIDGAVEFTRDLAEDFELIILTARFSRLSKQKDIDHLEEVIRAWLSEHGMEWDSVHSGIGKPAAAIYIDDRAVPCRPQDEGMKAFEKTAKAARKLAGK